jgi:hypothetical protein
MPAVSRAGAKVAWPIIASICAIIARPIIYTPWVVARSVIDRAGIIVARCVVNRWIIIAWPWAVISITIGGSGSCCRDQISEKGTSNHSGRDSTAAPTVVIVSTMVASSIAAPMLRVRRFSAAHHNQGNSGDGCEFPHVSLLATAPFISRLS